MSSNQKPFMNKNETSNADCLQRRVRHFRLHWKHGETQDIETEHTGNRMEACADAMNNAGIGGGALRALDYWEELKVPNIRS